MALSINSVDVPLTLVHKFVRQYSHDFRNHLGALDLQAAFLTELVTDPESAGEVSRLRTMVADAVAALEVVSCRMSVPCPSFLSLDVKLFVEVLKERILSFFPEESARLIWSVELAAGVVSVDLEIVFRAFAELIGNALFFQVPAGDLPIRVTQEAGQLRCEIFEKLLVLPEAPEHWGVVPFESTRRGAYGLGLFHARQSLDLHGGAVSFVCDPGQSQLITVINLPIGSGTHNGS